MTSESSTQNATNATSTLARTMGLGALIIYGVGDMLGAGVYGLIGKTAGEMGNAVWLAFVAAMVAAMLTGLSYASLGSRYPRAGGVAFVTQRAFGWPFLSYVIGLAVVASGLTSFATGARAFAGYFDAFMHGDFASKAIPLWIVAVYVVFLTLVNLRGMKESTWMNALCTFIEVTGLAIVIVVGLRFWGGIDLLAVPQTVIPTGDKAADVAAQSAALTNLSGSISLSLVLQGAILTFYSFLGFEDLMNVSEEVKNPQRNFPRGIIAALLITTVIYITIAITAVSVLSPAQLAASKQPLVDVVAKAAPAFPSWLFSLIALFAIANTGLLNYIMGSRLIYGMARQGLVPAFLGAIHPKRRTPHWAILVLGVIVMLLAMSMDVGPLAKATSTLLLTVFIIVNLSLLVLQRKRDEPRGQFEIPAFVPALGILVCAAILSQVKPDSSADIHPLLRDPRLVAGAIIAAIAALYFVVKPKNITEDALSEAAHAE